MEEKPFYQGAQEFTEPSIAKLYFQTIIGNEERENFVVLFLDRIHRLIKSEVMFQGSVSEISVSIREIIRQAFKAKCISNYHWAQSSNWKYLSLVMLTNI